MTTFQNKCNILGEFWQDYRHIDELKDFAEYNDLGLPMAYFLAEELVSPTSIAENYVNETFDLFIASLEIDPKLDYESLDHVFHVANIEQK